MIRFIESVNENTKMTKQKNNKTKKIMFVESKFSRFRFKYSTNKMKQTFSKFRNPISFFKKK